MDVVCWRNKEVVLETDPGLRDQLYSRELSSVKGHMFRSDVLENLARQIA